MNRAYHGFGRHFAGQAKWLEIERLYGNSMSNTFNSTFFFRCSPRGFSAICLQQMQGSVVEGLSQTATSGSQCFFLSEPLSCALS